MKSRCCAEAESFAKRHNRRHTTDGIVHASTPFTTASTGFLFRDLQVGSQRGFRVCARVFVR
jgi:hypothetical protein